MWLFNPEVSKYLTLVYAKNTVRVYKVNKDALKTVEPVMYGMTKDEVDAWNSKVKAYYGDNW
jgi:hypothetical protein